MTPVTFLRGRGTRSVTKLLRRADLQVSKSPSRQEGHPGHPLPHRPWNAGVLDLPPEPWAGLSGFLPASSALSGAFLPAVLGAKPDATRGCCFLRLQSQGSCSGGEGVPASTRSLWEGALTLGSHPALASANWAVRQSLHFSRALFSQLRNGLMTPLPGRHKTDACAWHGSPRWTGALSAPSLLLNTWGWDKDLGALDTALSTSVWQTS